MNSDHVATIREALTEYEYARRAFYDGEPKAMADAEAAKRALAALGEDAGWEPLPDGEVSSFMYVDNGGKLLGVYAGDDYTDWYATEDLPDDIRLCRKRPPAQG